MLREGEFRACFLGGGHLPGAFVIHLGGLASAMGLHLQGRQLVAELLDHVAPNAVLPQLRFDEAPAPRSVPIALLHPPPREGDVVDQAERG